MHSLLLAEGYEYFVLGHGKQAQVDIANDQDVFDSLNHGLEEASGVFFVATGGCNEAEPGEHGNDHGHLDDDGVDVGVYAEDFEVFGLMLIQDSMVVSLMAMDEKPMKNPKTSSMKKVA